MRKIADDEVVRCIGWTACCQENCNHYAPHYASFNRGCTAQRQVQYCPRAKGFVTDILMSDIDSNLRGNPNLAFKHRKTVAKEEGNWNS